MYREQCALVRNAAGLNRKAAVVTDAAKAKRVKTLTRAGEAGRALQSVGGTSSVTVAPDVVEEVSAMYLSAQKVGMSGVTAPAPPRYGHGVADQCSDKAVETLAQTLCAWPSGHEE